MKYKKHLFFYLIVFTTFANCNYTNICELKINIANGQSGWCVLIYDTNTNLDLSAIYLDTNNCVKVGNEKEMDGCKKLIFNQKGDEISNVSAKMPLLTGITKTINAFCFYVLNDDEMKLPKETWIDPNPYQNKVRNNLRLKLKEVRKLYYPN